MFLHIGNNIIIENRDLIGIFDMVCLEKSPAFEEMYDKLKEKDCIIDISNGVKKSFILLKQGKAYISHISSLTLTKRIK